MHVAGYVLTAVPVLLGLYFEIDALVLVLMTVCVVVHLGLGWVDTAYTQPRRVIGAVEQAVHPFLELLPVFALAVVAVLYADAWRLSEWTLRWRTAPLPGGVVAGVTLALVPGLALTVEELVRCWRKAGTKAPRRASRWPVPVCCKSGMSPLRLGTGADPFAHGAVRVTDGRGTDAALPVLRALRIPDARVVLVRPRIETRGRPGRAHGVAILGVDRVEPAVPGMSFPRLAGVSFPRRAAGARTRHRCAPAMGRRSTAA